MHVDNGFIKKDLKRTIWLSGLWLIILAMETLFQSSDLIFFMNNLKFQLEAPSLFRCLQFLEYVMIFIFIPFIIQTDPMIGTTAFWLTRPIKRSTLFASKLLLVSVIFIVAPLLMELLAFQLNSVPVNLMLLAILEILIERTAWVIPIVLLAVLTPSFQRFTVLTLMFLAVWVVSQISLYTLAQYYPHLASLLGYSEGPIKISLQDSIWLIKNLTTIVLGSALITHQYLTRNTFRTVLGSAAAAILLLMLVVSCKTWKLDIFAVSPPAASLALENVKMDVDLSQGAVRDILRMQKKEPPRKYFSAGVRFYELPATYCAIPRTAESILLEFPDGTALNSLNQVFYSYFINEYEFGQEALEHTFPDKLFLNRSRGRDFYSTLGMFEVNEERYLANLNKSGTYSANMTLDIYQFYPATALPLHAGVNEKSTSTQLAIFDVRQRPEGCSVSFLTRKVDLLFKRLRLKTLGLNESRTEFTPEIYALRNSKRGEIILPNKHDVLESFDDPFDDLINSGLRLKRKFRFYTFTRPSGQKAGAYPVLNKAWLKDAELIRIDAKKIGTIKKTFAFRPFALPEKSAVSEDY